MWRDELQAWSLVRESGTLPELFHNMRYEGSRLWLLLLWITSFFTTSALAMQLFHFICSLIAQLLVMSRAPFSGNMKLAIVAGYYISFEYCLISRAYVLGVLLTFLLCSFQTWLASRPITRGFILGLLANTSLYGTLLSFVFVADELWMDIKSRRESRISNVPHKSRLIGFFASYGLLLSIAMIFTLLLLPAAPDKYYDQGWLDFNLIKAIHLLLRNFIFLVPIPAATPAFWDTFAVLDSAWSTPWMVIPSGLGVMVAVWFALRQSPRYLVLFLVGVAAIWFLTVFKFYGFMRHIGTEMILFIACIWLAEDLRIAKHTVASRWTNSAIWLILMANVLAWGMASYYHARYEFSGAREMAQFIKSSDLRTLPIVADSDTATSAVAGYLNKPLYYAANRKAQTYIRWNRERIGADINDLINFANELAAANNGTVLLLLNYPWEYGSAKLLARTKDTIVADEVFYLYKYEP